MLTWLKLGLSHFKLVALDNQWRFKKTLSRKTSSTSKGVWKITDIKMVSRNEQSSKWKCEFTGPNFFFLVLNKNWKIYGLVLIVRTEWIADPTFRSVDEVLTSYPKETDIKILI